MSGETNNIVPIKQEPTNADLEAQIVELTRTVEVLTASMGDLSSAWNNAKGIVSFIKWCAGLAASIAVVWAAIHGDHRP